MAVTFDTASTAQSLSNESSKSWSHTATGSDRVGIVALAWSTDSITVSSVTWGGNNCTLIGTATLSGWHKAALYYIVAPPTSSSTVAVTFSGNAYGAVASLSFAGADQSTPTGTPVTNTNTSAVSSSVNVSSATGDMVVDCVKHYPAADGSGAPAVGASQTSRWAGEDGTYHENGAGSTEAGAGTVAMSWSTGENDAWAHIAVNLIAAAGGTGATVTASAVAVLSSVARGS